MGFGPMSVIEFINRAICAPTTPLGETPHWSWSNTTSDEFAALSQACQAAQKEGFDVDFNRPRGDMGVQVFSGNTPRHVLALRILPGKFAEWRAGTRKEESAKFSMVAFVATPEDRFHVLIGRTRIGAFLKMDLASAEVSSGFPRPGDFQRALHAASQDVGVELVDSEGSEAVVIRQSWQAPTEQNVLGLIAHARAFRDRFPLAPPNNDLCGYRP